MKLADSRRRRTLSRGASTAKSRSLLAESEFDRPATAPQEPHVVEGAPSLLLGHIARTAVDDRSFDVSLTAGARLTWGFSWTSTTRRCRHRPIGSMVACRTRRNAPNDGHQFVGGQQPPCTSRAARGSNALDSTGDLDTLAAHRATGTRAAHRPNRAVSPVTAGIRSSCQSWVWAHRPTVLLPASSPIGNAAACLAAALPHDRPGRFRVFRGSSSRARLREAARRTKTMPALRSGEAKPGRALPSPACDREFDRRSGAASIAPNDDIHDRPPSSSRPPRAASAPPPPLEGSGGRGDHRYFGLFAAGGLRRCARNSSGRSERR